MKRYFLNTDITSFSREEDLIAWFPLKSVILQVNPEGMETLRELRHEGLIASEENLQFLDGLADLELLSTEKKSPSQETPEAEEAGEMTSFSSLTFFMTEKCNLSCTYCYADGGTGTRIMKPEMINNAVSWMARHCAEKGNGELHIAFHGAGEPTMEGELIAGALLQAEKAALDFNLETFYSIGTNGIMKDETRKLLIDYAFDISLSLDGPENFHNRQRPMPGGNSFQEAWKTVEACTEADLPFSIRTTVTSDNIASLPEFTDFVFDNSTCEIIQFEPLYIRGRAAESAPLLPDPEEFVEILIRCMDSAEEFDGTVTYSGISYPEIREKFCQACSTSICVTPGGSITGCYESAGLEGDDPFLFGHIDASGDVKIDDAACQRISTMTTLEEKCSNCIARYHCAGDCPSKMTGRGENKNYRCSINRNLLKKLIIRRLDTAGAERIEFN